MLALFAIWSCSLTAPRASDVDELLEGMRRRTNTLDSFVATYSIESPKRKGTLTLTYDAPDRACVRMDAEDMSMATWLIDERMYVRGGGDGDRTHADVELEPLGDLDRAFDREFPVQAPDPDEIRPGVVLHLGFEPMSKDASRHSLSVRVLRQEHRVAAVGWLANRSAWDSARHAGDQVVFEPSANASMALSVASGFIQEMRYPGEHGPVVVQLESLVVDASLPADSFEIPVRVAGAIERSREYQREMTRVFAMSVRRRMYALAKRDGLESRYGATVLHEKLTRVAELIHDHLAPDACSTWSEKVTTSTAGLFRAWRAEYEKARGDEAARRTLITELAEKRSGLAQAVAATRASYLDRIEGPSDADPISVASIVGCERAGAGRAFDRTVGDVLLGAFDEARQAVESDG